MVGQKVGQQTYIVRGVIDDKKGFTVRAHGDRLRELVEGKEK
jgi:hypothetical protein